MDTALPPGMKGWAGKRALQDRTASTCRIVRRHTGKPPEESTPPAIRVLCAAALLAPLAALATGKVGAESSFMKFAGTVLLQRIADLMFKASSQAGGGQAPMALDATRALLRNRRATIYGGAQEIHNDIAAKPVLSMS